MDRNLTLPPEHTRHGKYAGYVKVWKTSPETGESKLVLEKTNTILYTGSDVLSSALAGQPYSQITHMYFGFGNSTSSSFYTDIPTVGLSEGDDPFSGYSASSVGGLPPRGYIRLPLSYPAAFQAQTNYANNIPVFTTQISSATSAGGAPFDSVSPNSWIYECALVAAGSTNSPATDRIFSRIHFTPIQYDSNYNFTISWGVAFTSA